MIRSAAGKVMWVGRTTVFLVGLAVILALVFGVATSAMGANGKPFLLGKKNVASAISTLVKQGTGPALKLQVGAGQPPMAVNSSARVANLNAAFAGRADSATRADNADKLDGKDSADFAPYPIFAKVSPDGSLGEGSHVVSSRRRSTGDYVVTFDRDVSSCVHIAQPHSNPAFTLTRSGVEYLGGLASEVIVFQVDPAGNLVDGRFSLAVFCK